MTELAFPKSARLRKRRDYLRFHSDSKKFVGTSIIIRYRFGKELPPRLGITVKKTFGKAVLRNHFKRKVREAFRHIALELQNHLELSVMPKGPSQSFDYDQIQSDLLRFATYVKGQTLSKAE